MNQQRILAGTPWEYYGYPRRTKHKGSHGGWKKASKSRRQMTKASRRINRKASK